MAYLLLGVAIGGLLGLGVGVTLGAVLHALGVAARQRQQQEELSKLAVSAMAAIGREHAAVQQNLEQQVEGMLQ